MVSVIIPVYNTEKYLKRCIDSVLKQSYKDLEIILVDDGSTDSSNNICDEYANIDHRIRVIHKENGGLSSARNVGIELSTGNEITFLDSDDYINFNYIKNSIDLQKKYDADIVIMRMCFIAEDTNIEITDNKKEIIYKFSNEEAIEESLYQNLFSCCAPGKLYKKDVFKNIRFPLGKVSEDLAICHKILSNANKIVYSNQIGYYYRQRSFSIMHTFNPKRMEALEWTAEIEDYCINNYPQILNAAKCRTFNVAVHLLLDLPNSGEIRENCYRKIMKEIYRTRKTVILDNKVRKREKIAAILTFFGEDILKRVWNSKMAVKQKEN